MNFTLYIILSSLISYLITYFYSKYFPTLDIPDKRSSHSKPTITGGGFGFVLTSFIFSLLGIFREYIGANLFFILCIPLAIVGYFDDKLNLSRNFRFIIQIIVVCIIISFAIDFKNNIPIHYLYENQTLFLLLIPILILFGTGFINFINFMDGMDGLLSSTTLITFLYIGIFHDKFYLIIFGSLISFIFFNWEPAKVFMGDIGSTYIGGIILSALYTAPTLEESINILLINSPLLLDASTCLFFRIINKDNIFKAHKLHLYQRLNQKGLTHSKVTMIYFISTLFMTFSVLLGNNFIKLISLMILIIAGLILNNKFAKQFSFSYETHKFKR